MRKVRIAAIGAAAALIAGLGWAQPSTIPNGPSGENNSLASLRSYDQLLKALESAVHTSNGAATLHYAPWTSNTGRKGERGQAVYGAAKAAAMGFMRGIAQEGGRKGVTANCIALGTVAVEGGAVEETDQNRALIRPYPVGRLGRPDDPAPLAVLLCSDAGEWITGQVYPVNGGYTSTL